MRLFLRAVIVLSVVLVLSACGGGGGGRSVSLPDAMPDVTPTLPDVPETPAFTTSFQTTEAPSASEVAAYLRIHAGSGPWWAGNPALPDSIRWTDDPGLARFSETPTVLLPRRTTDLERAVAHHAVAIINTALPYDQHLRIEDSIIQDARQVTINSVPDNRILIAWHAETLTDDSNNPNPHAVIDYTKVYDVTQNRWEKTRLNAAKVNMHYDAGDGTAGIEVLVHELLHAIGLYGHVDEQFPTAYLANRGFGLLVGSLPPFSRLDEHEAASIHTLYTKLGVATEPEDLSASRLGSWDQHATVFAGRIVGNNGIATSFGVTTHNGLRQPWIENELHTKESYWTLEPLSANPDLHGTITWDGGLVGVTPDQAYVQGLTSIDVDMGTLTGTASFTNLEFWNDMPQAIGTGTQWNTGELEYPITVNGTYLRSTGGDAGTVNGVVYGFRHETIGGILERADLTAAFGAAR